MAKIELLDNNTIDKIAAGEVVESPKSVIKELVENAMDAGANSINVEIKSGGKELIRVSDNGCGIAKEDITKAFLRHATSKIHDIDDLQNVLTMGFRGEALASIASVSQVEFITKQESSLLGYHFCINGGISENVDEIGAPNGTTIIVRNLFYNTPARLKFLKSDTTEANHISDVLEHLALARPDIAITFISNGKVKFQTTGKNDLKEVIYRIYGRDTANDLVPISYDYNGITINGFLGKPSNNRPNRNYENYFINRRYIQSKMLSSSIEEAYREYLMQHKFPFCVLHMDINPAEIDVNVHPAKLEVRFHNNQAVYEMLRFAVSQTLHDNEMIADVSINTAEKEVIPVNRLEPFEQMNTNLVDSACIDISSKISVPEMDFVIFDDKEPASKCDENNNIQNVTEEHVNYINESVIKPEIKSTGRTFSDIIIDKPQQMKLFEEEKVLSENSRKKYKIIGQVFDTFWLITYGDSIFFIDQHAAHEKVNYERLVKRVNDNNVCSQILNPPIVVSLIPKEQLILEENMNYFKKLGFEVEELGGREFALRSVPLECYNNSPKDLFLDVMEELARSEGLLSGNTPEAVLNNIATMACKASVKGNMQMSLQEMDTLIDELLTLDNPYHCPHGRPTIFSMSRYELEKKFKRIV